MIFIFEARNEMVSVSLLEFEIFEIQIENDCHGMVGEIITILIIIDGTHLFC
jgi:hypothetical protein